MNCSPKNRLFFFCMVIFFLFLSGLSVVAKRPKENDMEEREKFFAENKFKEAIIEYKNVLQIVPKDANAHYKLGFRT